MKAPGRSSGGGLLEAVTEMSSSWGELGRELAGLVVLCACIVVGVSEVTSANNFELDNEQEMAVRIIS